MRAEAANGTSASHAAVTRPGPRDPQTRQGHPQPREAARSPPRTPARAPRLGWPRAYEDAQDAGRGQASLRGRPPDTGTWAPDPTPGFREEDPSTRLPAPPRPSAARSPSIPPRERPTHRLLHGGRHLGTGPPRAAGRASAARCSSLPSLTPCWPRTPAKYNTVSTGPRSGSSTRAC